MDRSEKLDKIAPAILALQRDLDPVKKDARGHHGTYATLGACIEEIIPKANALDLTITQWGGGQAIETMIMHSSGQFIAGSLDLILKSLDPQAQGGAITYARRYMLSASVSLAAEDDDGQAATDKARAATTQSNPPAGTSPSPQEQAAPAQNRGTGGQSSERWWPEGVWRGNYQFEGLQKAAEEAGLMKEQIDKYVAAMKYERTKNNGDKFTVRSAEYLDKPLRADMEVRINTGAVAAYFAGPKEGENDIPDNYGAQAGGEMATDEQLADMDKIKGEVTPEAFQEALKFAAIQSRETTTKDQADKFIAHIYIPF